MPRSLNDRLFPWALGLSLAAHLAVPFLPGSDSLEAPDFKVEERMAVEPMTVRIIQPDPVPVELAPVNTPRPLLTSDAGARTVESLDVQPVEFEREPRPEPKPVEPPEPPPPEALPELETKPLMEPLETPPPPEEEPLQESVKEPEPVAPPPKDVPVKTGPIEQESQSGVVSRATPRGKGNRAPRYPRRARAAKMEGTTELEVTVRPDGTVQKLEIFRSSGHPLLDDEALKAVKRWKFTPGKGPNGAPAEDRVIVPVTFRLRKK